MNPEEEELQRILSVNQIEPAGEIHRLRPIKTEPPEPTPVTKVNGEELSELEARVKRDTDLISSLTDKEKKDALEREAEVEQLEIEHQERKEGKTPLRLIAQYKKSIGLWAAIGAGAAIVSKIAGCF